MAAAVCARRSAAGGIRRAHRDIRRAQDEQEERTAAAPDEHAESAAAGVERAAARLPPQCSHAEPFIHVPNLSPRSARRSAKKTMSPPACRTAIACALICQKRLKRDELMRKHQSDTISVGAGTVHEQGVNRSLNSGSGYFLEALDVCPVPTSGTGVYGARGSLNWPHRPEYRLVIQVDGVVRVSGDLARRMVLRAQIVRKCTPLSTNSFEPIRG